MSRLYYLGIQIYFGLIFMAAPFNQKARLWIRGRKKLLKKIKSRIHPDDKTAWFHCASLGEFEQGRPLIEAFKEKYPDFKILLTFYSPSGFEIRKNYQHAEYIFYLPLDTPRNAKKFLDQVNPKIIFFIKYEFWYFFLKEIAQRQIPLYLVSGIFRKEQRFFKSFNKKSRKMLGFFTHLFVQNNASKELLYSIGINNVTITGDTRFDRVYTIAKQAKELPLIERFKENSKVFIAGSTWKPDEEIIGNYYHKHPEKFKLIVAPHEVASQNVERIIKLFASQNNVIKYSEASIQNIHQAEVLIIDCIGLLSSLYQYGEIAYIGGGFGKGIHNILEAATFGMPVIFGPNHEKFQEAIDLIRLGGAVPVQNENDFEQVTNRIIDDKKLLKEKAEIASGYVKQKTGATQKILSSIEIH
ncbi:MAG: glycosyltransferase N-terminal domain-containing protein [Bacteroidales bacterium]|jgi:3-deoxy-D-manno-octulosonic-acid transferase|nr:glycosyltransferase N-terminal domain-containing protein [Bacteroidales bacterium]